MSSLSAIPLYGMEQRSDHADFYIRDKLARPAQISRRLNTCPKQADSLLFSSLTDQDNHHEHDFFL